MESNRVLLSVTEARNINAGTGFVHSLSATACYGALRANGTDVAP
jgi:hypothetical protein